VVLANNVTDTVTVTGTNNVSFTFPTPEASGATYAVDDQDAQPFESAADLRRRHGSGTVTSNITTVGIVLSATVDCTIAEH